MKRGDASRQSREKVESPWIKRVMGLSGSRTRHRRRHTPVLPIPNILGRDPQPCICNIPDVRKQLKRDNEASSINIKSHVINAFMLHMLL
jgi:hypothetical protein